MKAGVYKIEHTDSGKVYIGSSRDFKTRMRKHREQLIRGEHTNPHMQLAWNKYGTDAFTFKPLIICNDHDVLLYEQIAMDAWQCYRKENGYNKRIIAESNAFMPSPKMNHKIGQSRGQLTLVEFVKKDKNGIHHWLCRCTCGKEKVCNVSAIKAGTIRSCGCAKTRMLNKRREHFPGEKYYRLTLLSFSGKNKKELNTWLCLCDCGQKTTVPISYLQRGITKSCGCYGRDFHREKLKAYQAAKNKKAQT